MPFEIRTARRSDVDGLEAIEAAAFPGDRLSRRSFRRLLSGGTAAVEVAEGAEGIAGYCVVLFRAGSAVARLYSIAVAPGFTGVGRSLLAAAEQAARLRGAGELRLEVRADNPRAIDLYERNGYRRFGEIAAYYEDGQRAVRFRKLLRAEAARAAPPGAAGPSTGGLRSGLAAAPCR